MDVIHSGGTESRAKLGGARTREASFLGKTTRADPSYAQDPRWLLVNRILATPDFERAPRLSDLLRHICRLTLEGRSNEIHEQSLGEVVFERSPGYDSSVDTIVRSHALRLRHRLASYFSGEGAHEPLQIEIPHGGYVPRFYTPQREVPAVPEIHVKAEAPADTPASEIGCPQPPPHVPPRERWLQRTWITFSLAAIFVGAAAITAAYRFGQNAAPTAVQAGIQQTEIESRFWSSLFPPNGRTLIVPGDSGLVLYETVTGRDVSLSHYIDGSYLEPNRTKTISSTVSKGQPIEAAQLASDLASRRYTSIVDLNISSRFTHVPEWSAEHAAIVFARDLRPADVAGSNLIVIGSREANPWISLVEPSMNFILTRDNKGVFYFLNRHPRGNELKSYHPKNESGDLGAADVYGDVAYLPNPGGSGMVLALSGIWMSGTQAAANFVFDGAQFSSWLKSIANADGTIPPFEVLIGTKNLQGNAAYSSILAKRVAPRH